jgi:glycosyltransferase involved in cell wall biosynthesis
MVDTNIEISVVVPVSERHDDVRELYVDYKKGLTATGRRYELIFVLDGQFPDVFQMLEELREAGEAIQIIILAQSFGEATALSAGFEHATGEVILTLPAYYQVEPSDISKLLDGLAGQDMAIGRRWPRTDSAFRQLQNQVFHGILNFVADCSFHDIGCGMRAFRREILEEIPLYGDQHRFLPVLAEGRGFSVCEVDVVQSTRDVAPNLYDSGIYLRRILDILTVFFLVKFTKKPLRFFGLIGSATFGVGAVVLVIITVQRLFAGMALAGRPALFLSTLFVVLGVQLFALGLIGELIIFTHARDIREYTIEKIID